MGKPNRANADNMHSILIRSNALAQSMKRSKRGLESDWLAASTILLSTISASAAPLPGLKPYCDGRIRVSDTAGRDMLKINTLDVLKMNTLDMLKIKTLDMLKINTLDMLKISILDVLKMNTLDM